MGIYDIDSANPLQHYADLQSVDELLETVRTVTLAGRNWKYYRIEVVRRYGDRPGGRPYDYGVLVFVEDVHRVERTLDYQTYHAGQTRIFTRWISFPDVSEDDPDAALRRALHLLLERVDG